MSLINRLLKANPSAQVSDMLTGSFTIPSAKGVFSLDLAGVRGVFMSGAGISNTVIDYVTITTTGNATDFGDMTVATESNGGASSDTRGLSAGGERSGGSPRSDVIEYITIATTGNGTDFGDLQAGAYWIAGTSNQTRALFGTGTESSGTISKRVSYVTIASAGNAVSFGDATSTLQRTRGMGTASSSTRALWAGGMGVDSSTMNEIIYFTIATTGNATDFGDLTVARSMMSGGASSGTRALFAGGLDNGNTAALNIIDFVTIASTGNATDFGDLTGASQTGTTSTISRAVHMRNSSSSNTIDFTTIASAGNATDFGDATVTRTNGMACVSNGHGGLL